MRVVETIRFAKSIPLNNFQATFFTPFPGSPAYDEAGAYGTLDRDWKKMNMWDIVFVPHGLTAEALRRYSKQIHREFYLRPRIVWSYMKLMKDREYRKVLLKEGLHFLHDVMA